MTEPLSLRDHGADLQHEASKAPLFCRQLVRSLLADAERAALDDVNVVIERIEEVMRVLTETGVGELPDPAQRGGLAPWQARLLERHIVDNIAGSLRISDLARLVRLSAGYFGLAFKTSFGCSPRAYVMRARIAAAKAMMLETGQPLSQIALGCGFCDQAHFSRLFRRTTGEAPCAWRRNRQAMARA